MSARMKKAKLQQFILHEVVDGKSWQDADKVLKKLIQQQLDQFDNWRKGKDGNWKILSIVGPSGNYAQVQDVDKQMRAISTMQVLYEE
jgi:hypothetical protein